MPTNRRVGRRRTLPPRSRRRETEVRVVRKGRGGKKGAERGDTGGGGAKATRRGSGGRQVGHCLEGGRIYFAAEKPVKGHRNDVEGWQGQQKDISAIRRSERRWRRSESRLSSTLVSTIRRSESSDKTLIMKAV